MSAQTAGSLSQCHRLDIQLPLHLVLLHTCSAQTSVSALRNTASCYLLISQSVTVDHHCNNKCTHTHLILFRGPGLASCFLEREHSLVQNFSMTGCLPFLTPTTEIVAFIKLLLREQRRRPDRSIQNHYTHTPFNGPFSRTTRVSRYQKGKTNLDFTEARDSAWQWHQLGHMQVCTSLQTDNHASIPPLSFFTGRMPFLLPNQQRQSTESQEKKSLQAEKKSRQKISSHFTSHVIICEVSATS